MKLPSELEYGYHRTPRPENVLSIAKGRFVPGGGDMYGKGWYCCSDIESQLDPHMAAYGSTLCRCRMKLNGLIFFDYINAKKVFGSKDYTIVKQLLQYGIYKNESSIPYFLQQISEACEITTNESERNWSAVFAGNCFVSGFPVKMIQKNKYNAVAKGSTPDAFVGRDGLCKIKGIFGIQFSGNHDNNVYVIYNANATYPDAYVECDSNELRNVIKGDPSKLKWIPIKDYGKLGLQKYDIEDMIYKKLSGGTIREMDYERCEGMTQKDFENQFAWLEKTGYKDLKLSFFGSNHNYNCDVTGGQWIRGHFCGNDMSYTEFKGGVFRGNEFKYGIFNYGVFAGNSFDASSFKGGNWSANPDAWKSNSSMEMNRFNAIDSDGEIMAYEGTPADLPKNYKPKKYDA